MLAQRMPLQLSRQLSLPAQRPEDDVWAQGVPLKKLLPEQAL